MYLEPIEYVYTLVTYNKVDTTSQGFQKFISHLSHVIKYMLLYKGFRNGFFFLTFVTYDKVDLISH